ncbi:MAG: hypothetical protein OXG15_03550 [Gammaproteobacteria bacterium]|nr:hypothetical protein [Gammaproteobacteria bacterium]
MSLTPSLIGLMTLIGVLSSVSCWSAEDGISQSMKGDSSNMFSFGDPSSFGHASDEQKQILIGIAESEFDLGHLSDDERDLAYEALGKSGVEVQSGCRIEMEVEGSLGAFLIRRKHHEKTRFDPTLGVYEFPSEKNKSAESVGWKRPAGDYTEYPYPFGDARLMPKVIPVNLSSISVIDRDATHVKFDAKPSALLFEKMRPEERILSAEQLGVEFDVDRTTRRVSRLTLYLPEGVKVYRGIKITSLRFEYEFEEDSAVGRNVLKRVHHAMRGRIGGIFRPNFGFTTDLSYEDCGGTLKNQSYLLEAIESIRELR